MTFDNWFIVTFKHGAFIWGGINVKWGGDFGTVTTTTGCVSVVLFQSVQFSIYLFIFNDNRWKKVLFLQC